MFFVVKNAVCDPVCPCQPASGFPDAGAPFSIAPVVSAWRHGVRSVGDLPDRSAHAARRLIDDGRDVDGIGTGPLIDSIGKGRIAAIYEVWARPKLPFPQPPK